IHSLRWRLSLTSGKCPHSGAENGIIQRYEMSSSDLQCKWSDSILMPELPTHFLTQFEKAATIADQWTAARELMAARQLTSQIGSDEFVRGFDCLCLAEKERVGVDRLIAVDLIVRLSKFAKKLMPKAQGALTAALATELPPSWLLVHSKSLPPVAKPAEVR